jgi:predicted Na+-dependent transporter
MNLLLYANLAYNADVTNDLDWVSVFIALAVVISAIAMGLYCSYRSHSYKFNILCNKAGNVAGFLLIVFSATVTNTGDADSKIWSRHWSFYVAIMLPCIMGLIIASGLASLLRLLRPEQMTVAIECCYQVCRRQQVSSFGHDVLLFRNNVTVFTHRTTISYKIPYFFLFF